MRERPQLTPAALANGHRVPCGHEQNMPTMPRRRVFGSLGTSDVFLREEPDEEDEEEDEGDGKDDNDDDDNDDGYSE